MLFLGNGRTMGRVQKISIFISSDDICSSSKVAVTGASKINDVLCSLQSSFFYVEHPSWPVCTRYIFQFLRGESVTTNSFGLCTVAIIRPYKNMN
jgi:hypothetical protein